MLQKSIQMPNLVSLTLFRMWPPSGAISSPELVQPDVGISTENLMPFWLRL
jgi:hypothetical protein